MMMRRVIRVLRQIYFGLTSRDTAHYWERRYRAGWTSGSGSEGELARFKADFLNSFVLAHGIRDVIEFGCGDGEQLQLATYPRYLGFDVSRTAISLCATKFANDPSKAFIWYDPTLAANIGTFIRADVAISLDVVYHLLEDEAYISYLRNLFQSARRFVIIYSSDRVDAATASHVKHRQFTSYVRVQFPEFALRERIDNPHRDQSLADFFVYERLAAGLNRPTSSV